MYHIPRNIYGVPVSLRVLLVDFVAPGAYGCQAELRNGRAVRQKACLRVAAQPANEDDLVYHGFSPCDGVINNRRARAVS